MNNLIFSRQDVNDALWIINSDAELNHGLPFMIWAWKVIAWYMNLYNIVKSRFTKLVSQGLSVTVEEILDEVIQSCKANKLKILFI